MRELICIVCPNGCALSVDEAGNVSGAGCPKGEAFAKEETTCPKRTVCSTVATVFPDFPVLPVRTSEAIAKDKIFELMKLISGVRLERRVERGEVIIADLFGTGVSLISTSAMSYDYFKK